MKRFAFLLLAAFLPACHRQPQLTNYYPVPDFSLTDQAGKPVRLHDLSGKVWVADFIFTHCGGTCPMMTDRMLKLQTTLPNEIHLVSFTVDPDRDTSQALAAYAQEHGASHDRWLFLTGDKQAMFDICFKGFKLPLDYEGGTPAEPITHSTRFVLVDRHGDIRGYYSGLEDEALKQLAADAGSLL